MNLNFLQSLLIGFVSGLTEMLPISAEAHRTILMTLFGVEQEDAVFRLLVHIATLIALYACFQNEVHALRRTSAQMRIPPKRRRKPLDPASAGTVRLLRSATVIMIILRVLSNTLSRNMEKLPLVTLGLFVTGFLLFIPRVVRSGNMDSRNMPRINGLLMGFGGGIGGVAGFSPLGCAMSLGHWQGVDRQYAMNFGYLLMIPGLILQTVTDLGAIIGGGAAAFSFTGLLIAIAGASVSAAGVVLGVNLMRKLVKNAGFTGFAYYCWGAALVCFILFLSI